MKMKLLSFLIIFYSASHVFAQVQFNKISQKVFHISDEKTSVKATLIRDNDEAILIDAMYDDFAREIKAYIEKEGLNLKYLINTHYHGDHTGGNEHFKGTDIIAHENTHKNILDSAQYGPPLTFTKEDIPNILFKSQLKLMLGNTEVAINNYGSAHKAGDVVVRIPSENIICVGDIILDANKTLPYATNPEGMLSVLQKIYTFLDEDSQVITGHGIIATKEDVESLIMIMEETIGYVKNGNDINDYPAAWNQWDSEFLTMSKWLQILDKKIE